MSAATPGSAQYRGVIARDPAHGGYYRGRRRLDTMSPHQHHSQCHKHLVGTLEVDRIRNAHRGLRSFDCHARVSTCEVNTYTRPERLISESVAGQGADPLLEGRAQLCAHHVATKAVYENVGVLASSCAVSRNTCDQRNGRDGE